VGSVENVEADAKKDEDEEYSEGNPLNHCLPFEYVEVLEHW